MEPDRSEPATVEVYVRSLSPEGSPRQKALIDRLETLTAEEVIDDWTVHVVGRELCPDTATSTEPGRFICQRIEQFDEWAARNGMTLGSFFETNPVTSQIDDNNYERIVPPTVTTAEFDAEGSLQFVAPSSDGETVYTPADRLDELAERLGNDSDLAVPPR